MTREEQAKILATPLSPEETRWVDELLEKLPDEVDLTFQEARMLARMSIREWPDSLVMKVKDVIDVEDFLEEGDER